MKASRRGLIGRMALVAAAIATLITAGTQQAAGDITDNLIGHWKLDEASGTTAADSSVSGITGTLVNNPLWVAGKINGALDFINGSNQKVTLASNPALAMGSDNYTFAAWINPDGTTVYNGILGTLSIGGVGFSFDNGATKRLWVTCRNRWDTPSPEMPISIGSWNHVAVVMDRTGAKVTFYLNGVAYSGTYDAAKVGDAGVQTDTIGLERTDFWFDGKIDDVRIYNRALTASDVTELYNYTPPEIMTGSVLIVR